jgi:hypothetical protein
MLKPIKLDQLLTTMEEIGFGNHHMSAAHP